MARLHCTPVNSCSTRLREFPYGGNGGVRADGGANHGFRNIKGALDRIGDVPELRNDEALRDRVKSLNLPSSAFTTVGCVSGLVNEEQGHRVTGYVEFAFDSTCKMADAASYFPVFFHFDRALHVTGFDDRVHFHWELMGANFVKAQVGGFTATVTINTDFHPTAKAAAAAWSNGLDFLSGYLS